MSTCYPLLFRPIFKEKVWGGRALASLGKALPPGNIGESWELADLDSTSASGAGGGAEHSLIANGPLAGRSLRDAMHLWRQDLLGLTRSAGAFPLLIKFLDAREHLSVQVHPSPDFARQNPAAALKTECWYVLSAQRVDGRDPVIFKGLRPGVTREGLEQAVRDGRVPDVLQPWPAIVGECHNLPSGTIHALGAGVVVAEVQTPSDTTFRVYDWVREYARPPRALHIRETLACTLAQDPPPVTRFRTEHPSEPTRLVTTEFFTVDELRLHAGLSRSLLASPVGVSPAEIHRAHAIVLLRGSLTLTSDARSFEPLALDAGATALLPASIVPDVILTATHDATLLVVDVLG